MDETLQGELKKMEAELLSLKQSSKVPSLIRANTFYLSSTDAAGRYTVSYASGDQPIISEFYRVNGDVVQATPNGNSQYIWVQSQVNGALLVMSTRKINSIVKS